MKDYYKVLNIDKGSSIDIIKKRFRKLSLQHHPDRGGDVEKFKEINEAYKTLGDKDSRKQYDMMFNNPFNTGGSININDILQSMFNTNHSNDIFNTMNSNIPGGMPNVRIFHNGRPFHQNFNRVPTEIVKSIKITYEDAFNGIKVPLEIERWVMENNIKTSEHETIYIELIKGIDNNEIIHINNKGNIINGVKGKIKVKVNILPHNIYKRRGLDIILNKELTLKEALLGFEFNMKHLNGKKYSINNNNNQDIIHNNTSMKIDNLGFNRDNIVGKLIINFTVKLPTMLSDKQKEKLKNIL